MWHGTGREREGLFVLVACLATLALPLARFDQSLWRDEATSIWFARLPVSTLLTALCDPHPPGYYLVLKAWSAAGGESEFGLRMPSLLAAVLAVALTYRLGRELCGDRCAWLAALLVAVHPLQSWYAGEARMYTLSQCLGLLVVWLGWRWLLAPAHRAHAWQAAAAYWLAALLALGIDYSVLLAIGLLQLLWLARGCLRARRWLIIQVAVLVPAGLMWVNAGQFQALGRSYPSILIAIQAGRFGLDLAPAGAARLLKVVTVGLALTSLGLVWGWSRYLDRRLNQSLVRGLLIGGWLALLVLAALPRAFTIKRQLVVLLPYLALLLGNVLGRLPRPAGELVGGIGLLVTLLALPGHARESWRDVIADLVQTQPDQSAVIWVDDLSVPVFDYYLRRGLAETDQVEWTPLSGRDLPQLPDVTPRPGHTLWVVTAESIYRHLNALWPNDFYHHYQLLEELHQPGIGVYRYRRWVEPAPIQAETPGSDHHQNAWGLLLPSPLDTCHP